MLLAVDIGNTNTVLGVFDGPKLVESWRVKTDARDTADELALTYRGLLGSTKVDGVAACSTVPAWASGPSPAARSLSRSGFREENITG